MKTVFPVEPNCVIWLYFLSCKPFAFPEIHNSLFPLDFGTSLTHSLSIIIFHVVQCIWKSTSCISPQNLPHFCHPTHILWTCCPALVPQSENRVAVNRGYIRNSDIAVPFGGLFKSFKWNEEVGKIGRFETEKRVRVNKALKVAHNIHLNVKPHNVRVQIFSWHWGKHRFNIHVNSFKNL